MDHPLRSFPWHAVAGSAFPRRTQDRGISVGFGRAGEGRAVDPEPDNECPGFLYKRVLRHPLDGVINAICAEKKETLPWS
jgi:hypothetical protein